MPVAPLTTFPASFVAGDTIRVTISDADYPAPGWTLRVLFSGPVNKSFDAAAEGTDFLLTLAASQTAELTGGQYTVSYVYMEDGSGERVTDDDVHLVAVFPDPAAVVTATTARETLDALKATLLILAQEPDATINFNGQSFTSRTLKDLQDAIDRQERVVAGEHSRNLALLRQPGPRFSQMRF